MLFAFVAFLLCAVSFAAFCFFVSFVSVVFVFEFCMLLFSAHVLLKQTKTRSAFTLAHLTTHDQDFYLVTYSLDSRSVDHS